MPFDKTKYPADWKAISLRIRERDKWECKWCGAKNGAWIVRWTDKDGDGFTVYTHAENMHDGSWHAWDEDEDGPCSDIHELVPALGDRKPIKVVLTVAHVDHNSANNADDNLAALCQQCHLRHDARQHAENAARTRVYKQRAAYAAAGQKELDL